MTGVVKQRLTTAKVSPVVLILLDGWGIAPPGLHNAFTETKWPNLRDYLQQYPLTALAVPAISCACAKEAYAQIGSGQDKAAIPGLGGVAKRPGLTELLAQAGSSQAYFGETEKFPLLVNYLADNYQGPQVDYQLVSTPLNNDYTEQVLAASQQVVDQTVRYWRQYQPDFLAVSLAAWSSAIKYGNLESVSKAIVALDKLLPKLINPIQQAGATVLLTSAYGCLENLIDPLTNKINISQSLNSVPFLIIGRSWTGQSLNESEIITDDLSVLPLGGSLKSIAPTILAIMGVDRPSYLDKPLLPARFNQTR